MRRSLWLFLLVISAIGFSSCSTDEEIEDNVALPFEVYDIMLSYQAADDDAAGRFNAMEDADPWRTGEIVYLERDGLFVYRDKQGNWSRHWGYAAYFGTYDPRGVRPIPGQKYFCTQTGCEYVADENGRLIPFDAPTIQIKVTTWNIGGFNNGNSGEFSAGSEENYFAVLDRFKPLIEELDADLVGLCEYLPSIFTNREIRADLLGQYPYAGISEVSSDYMGKAIFARFPLSKPKLLRVYDSTALEADATIGGRVFKVCICHPVWWKTDGDPNFKALKFLAERYKYVDRVILMGDFNFLREREEESLKLFSDVGFTPANIGPFGTFTTAYNSSLSSRAIDNIFVKGAEIISVSVKQITPEGLDPHNPRIEDEALWDEVNPSDHFPLSAELLIK